MDGWPSGAGPPLTFFDFFSDNEILGAPSLRFLQGREAMLSAQLLDRSVMLTFPLPPFAKSAKDTHPFS